MNETTLELKEMIKIIRKRCKLIISVFLVFVILAMVISWVIPPMYEAETNLRVKQPKGLGTSLLSDLPLDNSAYTKQLMNTYAEILKGRTIIESVIDQTQGGKEEIPTYESLLKRITTEPVKDTEILKIKVKAKSPEEAEWVANTLVNTFLDRMTFLVRAEQSNVRSFVGQRLQESKQELEQSEEALQVYKTQQKTVDPAEETKVMLTKLSDIDKLSAKNQAELAAAQAILGVTQQELNLEKPGFVADSPLIQQYKEKLADQEVLLVTLISKYTDKYPQVEATRAAIEATKTRLNAEIARVINADAPSMNPVHVGLVQGKIQAEAQIAAGTAQSQAIKSIVSANEQELSTLPLKEQGLMKVMRNASVDQEIYIMLAKRYEEARISEVMEPTEVQVIDVAIAPDKPISPKKILNILIAAILGLLVGTALAFLLENMNKTIKTAEDVQHYLGVPILGNIPDFDNRNKWQETRWNQFVQFIQVKLQRRG